MNCRPEKIRPCYISKVYNILESEPSGFYPRQMDTIQSIIWNLISVLKSSRLLIWYARIFVCALLSPKAKLAARPLAAESQLAVS